MQPDPTPADAISVRRAEPAEIGQLGQIWYDGWHEAHARILPAELTRVRTRESFEDRLAARQAEGRARAEPSRHTR